MAEQKRYFVENKEITESITKIRRLIRASMNGVTVESMQEKGLNYEKNFGVALPRLREIATQFEPNLQLATQLWLLGIRETMIIGSLLVPMHEFSCQNALEWHNKITTTELAEIISMTLFSKLPEVNQFIAIISADSDPIAQLTALCTATRVSESLPDELIQQIIANLRSSPQRSYTTANALSNFLIHIASEDKTHITLIESELHKIKEEKEAYSSAIVECVTKELSFLKQL